MALRWTVALVLLACLGCAGRQPSQPEPQGDPRARYLVAAHYYTWFPEAFDRGFLRGKLSPPQQPELGRYSSHDVKVAERHIDWAAEYGIDIFTLDYWPSQSEKDPRHEVFLSARNISDISFCILYETVDFGHDPSTDSLRFDQANSDRLVEDLEKIADRYFQHPSYFKIQGRPVVLLYITRTFTGSYESAIEQARRRLRDKGHDLFLIGDEVYWSSKPEGLTDPKIDPGISHEPQTRRIGLFDAITAYNFYHTDLPGHYGYGADSTFVQDVGSLSRRYAEATGGKVPVLPSVIPGYNDRAFRPENDHRAIPRQWSAGEAEGSFLSEMFDRYALPFVDESVPLIFVTSWNEWNEDTAIEPLRAAPATAKDDSGSEQFTQGYRYSGYGTTYLQVIRDKICAVSGVARGSNGAPLRGKEVYAWRAEELVAVDVTDSQGRFHLSRMTMSPGSYSVGLDRQTAVTVRVGSRQTASGLVLRSGPEVDPAPPAGPDLEPRRKDLNSGLAEYIEAFPRERYQVTASGDHRFYIDPVQDAVKETLRAGQVWDPSAQVQLRELLRPGDVVLEAGAHIGARTMLLSELVGSEGKVYAFEPRWDIYRELVQNLRLNSVSNVHALRYLLSDRAGVAKLEAGLESDGGTPPGPIGTQAEMRTLDSFNFPRVDLIAIDQKGFEDPILTGARETIERHRPILLLKLRGDSGQPTRRRIEELKGLLANMAYQARESGPDSYLALPVTGPEQTLLDLGTAASRNKLLKGFHRDETDGTTDFVWSDGRASTIAFSLERPAGSEYVLGMRVRAMPALAPLQAEVVLNDTVLGTVSAGKEWEALEIPVPAGTLKAGGNLLSFNYRKTGRPSALMGVANDHRDLAWGFDVVWLAPKEMALPRR